MLEHPVAKQWWWARNQDWPYYFTVLQSNYMLDGLEIWCECVATRTHITLMQKDSIQSPRAGGPDDGDFVIMWLVDGAVFCNICLDSSEAEVEAFEEPPRRRR